MTARRETSIATSDVVSMFPTFVWKIALKREVCDRIGRTLLEAVSSMRSDRPELAPGESWQSDNDLQRRAELGELCSGIEEAATAVLRFLSVSPAGLDITGCWVNVNAPGAAHRLHTHPNNFLSGVYYVRTHEGANVIYFHDPRPQTGIIRPGVTELTAANTDQVVVPVSDGSLLLFPAWLPHSVPPNESDENRISVSFNLMFSDYTNSMSAPLW